MYNIIHKIVYFIIYSKIEKLLVLYNLSKKLYIYLFIIIYIKSSYITIKILYLASLYWFIKEIIYQITISIIIYYLIMHLAI